VPASHRSSFTPCGTARPQLLFLWVGENFRCTLDELGWADRDKDLLAQQQCVCGGTSHHSLAKKMGRYVLVVAVGGCSRRKWPGPALQDRFVAEEFHGME